MLLIKKLLSKLIVLSFFCSANALSVEMTGLYDVTVAYDTVNFRSNRNAHKKALEKLLIRIMWSNDENISMLIEQYFPNPSRFIRQFKPNDDDSLIVSMDGEAIQEILLEANKNIWGADRPITIILVAIDKGMGEREVIIGDDVMSNLNQPQNTNNNQVMRQKMHAIANSRGVPILFPMKNDENQLSVNFSDIWGGFSENLTNIAKNYGASIVLSGKVRNDEREFNDWTLHFNNSSTSFSATPENAINFLADTLMARYSYSDRVPAKEIEIIFGNINSINNFGDIFLALSNLSMIESFTVEDIHEDYIQYLISYNGFTSDLVTSINNLNLWEKTARVPNKLQYNEKSILEYKLKL
ncbi:MAG: hypothetical protein ACI8XI_000865 [Woeseiaceae bacterium]|jgi:hypothetical protein|tara:strand:- start:7969 stop:9033 length:1065 start_codon:yes stop_codon:yes gene_type:complete